MAASHERTVAAETSDDEGAAAGLAGAGQRSRSLEAERVLAQVAAGLFEAEAEVEAPRIGEYFVLEKLGAGGMGAVYTAYDPTLDRKVAVKVLHGGAHDSEVRQQRLIREARSLARLNHPNVVKVHGAGAWEKGAYVAMEFVEGQDLSKWLASPARPWKEVVDVFLQAARGLQAAHAAGLVHRDFKPSNVLLGEDGVVRVADFGLARPTGESGDSGEAASISGATGISGTGSGRTRLTRTDGVVGTPRYMAPEQYVGSDVGPAADQYSFCLSLYEGLYGELPYKGKAAAQLATEKSLGELERPPGTSVPAWLFRLVRRGLRPRPEERWPDMRAIVHELEARRSGRRSRWIGLGTVAVAAAVAGSAWIGSQPEPATPPDPCANLEQELSHTWDEQDRTASRAAFLASGLPYAERSWETAAARLDEARTQWLGVRQKACREYQATRESASLYDRRQDCLRGMKGRLDVVVEGMVAADAGTVEHVDALLAQVPRMSTCEAPAGLLRQLLRPGELEERKRGEAVIQDVWRLRVALNRKHDAPPEELVERVRGAVADESLESWARAEGARTMATMAKDGKERRAFLDAAVFHALRCRNDELAVYSLIDLALDQNGKRQYGQALATINVAHGMIDRMEGYLQEVPKLQWVVGATRPHVLQIEGTVLNGMGRNEDALVKLERSVELWQPYREQHPILYVHAVNNLAEGLRPRGEYARAIELYSASIELVSLRFGNRHPVLGTIYNNRASAEIESGALAAARGDLEKARAIQVASHGEFNGMVGIIDYNRALVAISRGELEAAQGHLDSCEAIWTKTVGPRHPYLGLALATRATLARSEGKAEDALPLLDRAQANVHAAFKAEPHEFVATVLAERAATECALGHAAECEARARAALESFEGSIGVDHSAAAVTRGYLGDALALQDGRADEAEAAYRLAIEVLEQRGSKTHPDLAHPINGLAALRIAAGDADGARALLARNLELQEAEGIPPWELTRTRELLAQLD